MMKSRTYGMAGTFSACSALWLCVPALGQCELGWVNDFGGAQTLVEGEPATPDRITIVDTLASFDPDGGGPMPERLIAGGSFSHMGGVEATAIAQWDGHAWSVMGSGFHTESTRRARVVDIVVHDVDRDGPTPPLLYAATLGCYLDAGMSEYGTVLKWDGVAWSLVDDVDDGHSPTDPISLAFFDAGDGELLYATSLSNLLARFEKGEWREIWPGNGQRIGRKLIPSRIGSEKVLAFLGGFTFFSKEGELAEGVLGWNGPLLPYHGYFTGYRFMGFGLDGVVQDAVNFDEDGEGPLPESMYAVGRFLTASNDPSGLVSFPARDIARWDGVEWHAVGPEPARQWFQRGISAISVYNDGTGPALVAGGHMWVNEKHLIQGVARWTGAEWKRLGLSMGDDDYRGPRDPDFIVSAAQVRDFATLTDSTGRQTLVTSGVFRYADGLTADFITRLARPFERGDADGDGDVDYKDVAEVLERWAQAYWSENTGPGDVDANSVVDFADITFVLTHFGASCAP